MVAAVKISPSLDVGDTPSNSGVLLAAASSRTGETKAPQKPPARTAQPALIDAHAAQGSGAPLHHEVASSSALRPRTPALATGRLYVYRVHASPREVASGAAAGSWALRPEDTSSPRCPSSYVFEHMAALPRGRVNSVLAPPPWAARLAPAPERPFRASSFVVGVTLTVSVQL